MTDPTAPPPPPGWPPPAAPAAEPTASGPEVADPAAGPPPLPAPAPPPARELPIRFGGTGGEYFRIWAVNLLLTLVTLGLYSPWAKVRRTRWFWANTQLDGAGFQYQGNPAAILRGRLVVGAALVAYSLAGRLSVAAAVVASALLGLAAPWLFAKAFRFTLTNTTWRGLRFGFQSTTGQAYAVLGPAALLWVLLSAASATIRPGERKPEPSDFAGLFAVYAVILALTPLLHERYKRWQHGATTCGSLRFAFQPSPGAFYGLYGLTFAVGVVPFFVLGVGFAILAATLMPRDAAPGGSVYAIIAGAYAVMILAYLVPGAFFAARLQRLVWERTSAAGVRFASTVTMGGVLRVWFVNGLLTLLTLGLYWPWAAVAITRYKVERTRVLAAVPLEALAAGDGAVEPSATGDGAVDFLGLDFGL